MALLRTILASLFESTTTKLNSSFVYGWARPLFFAKCTNRPKTKDLWRGSSLPPTAVTKEAACPV